ncbi:MAG TPA: hypothetical protein VGQ18_12755 [Gemmatimonadales bacterium]|jgi:hypothetical protein|nr:hypothetical protein [Gemmatimonadales bacterium]
MRAVNVAAVLAIAVSVTTCRLDKLINPATADRLVVNPDSVRVSADSGSLVPKDTILRVASADGVALTWTATKTAGWVTLSPSAVSLVVTLHPDTLSQGLHLDTIRFASPQSKDTVKVPVVFDILPAAAHLDVSPGSRDTAAFVGSAQPDTFSLRIKNKGAVPLTWTAALSAPWITLSDSGGTVPPQDTTSTAVLVTLRPDTLSTGPHSGRIVFSAAGASGSPDTVPIAYRIDPCVPQLLMVDALDTASIALSDCGAPHRAGRQAKLYAVQAIAGDTLSFQLTAAAPAFNARLILTNGTAVLDSIDQCAALGVACIRNYLVTSPGQYVIEATTRDSGEIGAFTFSAVKELSPNAPAAGQFRANGTTAIGVGTVTPESTVVFKATLNDPNPFDSVRLDLELTDVATGTQIDSSAFVPRGTSVALSVTGLTDNDSYYWRARNCDKTGRCSTWFSFGGNVDPAPDFIVNSKPENPTIGTLGQIGANGPMAVGGGTGGTRNANVTVTFTAGVTDNDPQDQISIEVEYKRVGTAFDSTTVRGNGVPTGGTATHAVSILVPLLLNDTYHWRARVCDQTNRCSVWVPFGGNAESATDFQSP